MKLIYTAGSKEEAHEIRERLREAGIESFVEDPSEESITFSPAGLQTTHVWVREEDVTRAGEIVSEASPGE